jgi:hypothetical protein
VTSRASIEFKDEEKILKEVDNTDLVYVEKILMEKMRINLTSIRSQSNFYEVWCLFYTVASVFKERGK